MIFSVQRFIIFHRGADVGWIDTVQPFLVFQFFNHRRGGFTDSSCLGHTQFSPDEPTQKENDDPNKKGARQKLE
jgi:hypothetical protein